MTEVSAPAGLRAAAMLLMTAMTACSPFASRPPASAPTTAEAEEQIEPLVEPVLLRYRPGRFAQTRQVVIEIVSGRERRESVVETTVSGALDGAGGRLDGWLRLDQVVRDGRPGAGESPELAVGISPTGVVERIAVDGSEVTGQPASDGMRRFIALHLPELNPDPVGSGQPLFAAGVLALAARLPLEQQGHEVSEPEPVQAFATGIVACATGRCLLGEIDGRLAVASQTGAAMALARGQVLLDLETALIVDSALSFTFRPGGAQPGRQRLTIASEVRGGPQP